jgi:hypothetical protein
MSIFETTGSNDPFGVWEASPQALSFGIENESALGAGVPVYRVNLPGSGEDAAGALAEQLAGFERVQASLTQIPAQLDGLARRMQKPTAGLSFALDGSVPLSAPESELLSLLAETDAAALRGADLESGVSFGVSEAVGAALGQAREKFVALVEQVNRDILHFAWVETKVEGLLVARTKVGWSGDSTTLLHEAASPEHTRLHHQSLKVVAKTRTLKLSLLLSVTSGAVKVGVLMASPEGARLALPVVCEYVIKSLDQLKQIQTLHPLDKKKK